MKRFVLLIATAMMTGCETTIAGPTHVTCDPFLQSFGVAVGDTIDAGQGVRYIDIETGTGAAIAGGTTVDFNYSGYLLDGTRFDTSCPATTAVLRVRIGGNQVIPGFEIGMLGMRPGGVRRVIVPPEMGYGSAPYGPIPGNSTLVFDLEFVAFIPQ